MIVIMTYPSNARLVVGCLSCSVIVLLNDPRLNGNCDVDDDGVDDNAGALISVLVFSVLLDIYDSSTDVLFGFFT